MIPAIAAEERSLSSLSSSLFCFCLSHFVFLVLVNVVGFGAFICLAVVETGSVFLDSLDKTVDLLLAKLRVVTFEVEVGCVCDMILTTDKDDKKLGDGDESIVPPEVCSKSVVESKVVGMCVSLEGKPTAVCDETV